MRVTLLFSSDVIIRIFFNLSLKDWKAASSDTSNLILSNSTTSGSCAPTAAINASRASVCQALNAEELGPPLVAV